MSTPRPGFLELLRARSPEDAASVLTLIPDLAARLDPGRLRAWSKPKRALGAYQEVAGLLAPVVPHVLPLLYEHGAREFLGTDHGAYAARMLAAAREAEASYGLAVDHDHLDEVFAEFAVAGALPVKTVADHARELAARLPADAAFRRFARVCVRRTEAGLAPSPQMAAAVRRLAKAAGDQATLEQAHLAEMVAIPAIGTAPAGWWAAHRTALVALARREPWVRGTLLNLVPRFRVSMAGQQFRDLFAEWMGLLERTGATAGLGDGDGVPDEARPSGGTAEWLDRVLDAWGGWGPLPGLVPIVEGAAGRLRAELAGSGGAVRVPHDLNLLDLFLELEVPVADPAPDHRLELVRWAEQEDRRELRALAADARFAGAFAQGAGSFYDDERDLRTIRTLAASPGGRTMLVRWLEGLVRDAWGPGLPNLLEPHRLLDWLPPDVLALVDGLGEGDLVAEVVRTLRGGLFGELCWPAFEEAVAEVLEGGGRSVPHLADAWPYLIVAGESEVRVVGRDGCVLAHRHRVPGDCSASTVGFHFVDGSLLVFWRTLQGRLEGYWHTPGEPDPQPVPLAGPRDDPDGVSTSLTREWLRGLSATMTLPVDGGGRAAGGTVLRPGDLRVPDEYLVIGDGAAFWELKPWTRQWSPHASAGGTGDVPARLAERAAGGTLVPKQSWLRPARTDEVTPLGVPVDGLLGWVVTERPDGAVRGEDLAGRAVTIARPPRDGSGTGYPFGALVLPGDDRPRALMRNEMGFGWVRLIDPDGIVTATDAEAFRAGGPPLPPQAFWPLLRPRDPEGSAALRGIGRETVAALFKAARDGNEDLPALVRALVPRIGDDVLASAVAGVVRFAAGRQGFLDGVAATFTERRAEPELGDPRTDPSDSLLGSALGGLFLEEYREAIGFRGISGVVLACRQLRALHEALRDDRPAGRLHIGAPRLRSSSVDWGKLLGECAAVAFRAAAPATPPEEREALRRLLTLVDAVGLASAGSGRWRRFDLHLDTATLAEAHGGNGWNDWDDTMRGVLPLGGGAFLAVLEARNPTHGPRRHEYGCDFFALFHDPSGRFEVPAPYTVKSSAPLGADREPGWLTAFLDAWEEHGPVGLEESAATDFAERTGTDPATARLLVAGLPELQKKDFPSAELRALLALKPADAAVVGGEMARKAVRGIPAKVVGALLPADPARLWTDGPDVAAAAEVWNALVGRRKPVPEGLLGEAGTSVRRVPFNFRRTAWAPSDAVRALVDPAASPELTRDVRWVSRSVETVPADPDEPGFTDEVLVGAVAMAGWLAHRLPAGDRVRAVLPEALALVRERLAAPGMLLELRTRFSLPAFRNAVGEPDETGGPDPDWWPRDEGWERYGALLVPGHDYTANPVVRTALLDGSGGDPNLPVRHGLEESEHFWPEPAGEALRRAFDPAFAELLADPGDPAAGEPSEDGTWWPQDPQRSVPDLVAKVAADHGLGADAAALYLVLLAMPDPTDRNVARWTGWKPARLKTARAALAATGLVVEGRRPRAGRTLFLPGGWEALKAPHLPLETWKAALFEVVASPAWGSGKSTALGVIVPAEPVAGLYRRVWDRVQRGDAPG
ncbi:DNA-binding protein [Actinomadura viridis]|uniref:Rhodanese domain-containing protein n=1 Tax=Actinomadura viridis TaxID=58110 RepID=A0A931DGX5_9ACTN|nr:DNA-binding protein [Actinomadura viridis]MBG6087296.1 hypothetical protein [Actinomadura viridis]